VLYYPRGKQHHIFAGFIVSDNDQITYHHVRMPHNVNHYQEWYEVAWDDQIEVSDG
jgi:hypothetical protein